MLPSAEVRDALLDFYAKRTAGDAASFDALVSTEPTAFIGTAPGEWFADRERLRRGFAWAVRLDPGPNPQAWAEGSVGLAADEPTMTLPDGTVIRTRLTMFFRHEDGAWEGVRLSLLGRRPRRGGRGAATSLAYAAALTRGGRPT